MKLHELLKTKDPKKQVEDVQQLIQMAQAPVFDLSLLFDSRTGNLAIHSSQELPFEVIYGMLERARQLVQQKERETLAKPEE